MLLFLGMANTSHRILLSKSSQWCIVVNDFALKDDIPNSTTQNLKHTIIQYNNRSWVSLDQTIPTWFKKSSHPKNTTASRVFMASFWGPDRMSNLNKIQSNQLMMKLNSSKHQKPNLRPTSNNIPKVVTVTRWNTIK